MAAASTLKFSKSVIWGSNDHRMANKYLQTKFGANKSRNGRDSPLSKMAAANGREK